LSTKLSNAGDLDGILLTGISSDGINLLEKYVNKVNLSLKIIYYTGNVLGVEQY